METFNLKSFVINWNDFRTLEQQHQFSEKDEKKAQNFWSN